jgi:hypothetical protein
MAKALFRVFVDQCQDLDWPAIVGPIHHKISAPDMDAP